MQGGVGGIGGVWGGGGGGGVHLSDQQVVQGAKSPSPGPASVSPSCHFRK